MSEFEFSSNKYKYKNKSSDSSFEQDGGDEKDVKQQNAQSQFLWQSSSLEQDIEYLSSKTLQKQKNTTAKQLSKKGIAKDKQSKQQQAKQLILMKKQMNEKNTDCRALCLLNDYYPRQIKQFFLCNDVYIELDKNISNEIGFEQYRALQNELRPIARVKHYKESKFLVLEFDESKRGITDFTYIIECLKSMQDQQSYNLAESLILYNQLMNISQQIEMSVPLYERQMKIQRNKIQLEQYIQETIPDILKSLDPSKFFVYFLYDMSEGFHNQTRKQYGMNEKYINLFGSNVDDLTNVQLRQGWFNFTQYSDRNRQSIEYFFNIKAVYENSFDFKTVNIKLEYDMVTLENIKVPVQVIPQYHFCFSKTDTFPLTPNKPLLIGILYLMEITLQPHSKKTIRDIRCAHSSESIKNQNTSSSLSSISPKYNLPFSNQKYIDITNSIYSQDISDKTIQSYHKSAEKFIDTFLSNTSDTNSQLTLQTEKICKFVQI